MPINTAVQDALTADQLEAALRAGDPSVVLVPPWFLEKFLNRDRGVAGVFLFPRVKAQVVSREDLIEFARREELPLDQAPPDSETLLVLARPEPDVLASTPGTDLLLRYWRMAFHARVRAAVRGALQAQPDPRAAVQQRIEHVGRSIYHEARFVLVREKYLTHGADDLDSYAQFAALLLELTFFAPENVHVYFPLIENVVHVAAILGQAIDPDALLKSTRPPGAGDRHHEKTADQAAAAPNPNRLKKRAGRDAPSIASLLGRATEADVLGNDVRAAIYRMRVYRASATGSPGPSRSTVYAQALKDLDRLVSRLKEALQMDDSVARQWRAWLGALLENAAGGWWNAEGRLLYDLQKVCVYHEREIYSVNVVDFAIEFGRRPLKRPQPGQRLVLIVKALRSALRRMSRVRLAAQGRGELVKLLGAAIDNAERRLAEFLRPRVTEALAEGGLAPSTVAERVAHEKLIEELLDEIVAKGYLTFGSLRDAVSRNQMKLNDVVTPRDYVQGDQLLRIDRRLEEKLDYVYHRGEIYLRSFHRVSSLFFATMLGRFVTKWMLLPFGGAYLILEALDHSVGKLIHHIAQRPDSVRGIATSTAHDITGSFAPTHTAAAMQAVKADAVFSKPLVIVLVGLFMLGLINLPFFRRAAGNLVRQAWRLLRIGLVDFPHWLATRPLVRRIFTSLAMRHFARYVLKPLVLVGVALLFIPPTASARVHLLTLGLVFFVTNLVLNSRAGRAFEQSVLHSIRTTVARFGWEILVSVVRGIMNLFEAMLEAIDRLLYAVDEMLRFRAGQGGGAVVAKAILGVFWFYIAYVTRFVINLLVEPQINPIKHFPVVTVSHKMLLPTIPYLAGVLQKVGLPQATAVAYGTAIVTSIPGIFGFLAWEFKENWKLYKANRPKTIKPVRVGSHGETIASFLRPGFHSGTIPKLFHRLRKARRRAETGRKTLRPGVEAKYHHALQHVREEVEAFIKREFLALLNRHPLFAQAPVKLREVRLSATTIRIAFSSDHGSGGNGFEAGQHRPLAIRFEQRAYWILAAIDDPGMITTLSPERCEVLAAGILGLYKLAGVDIVEEHLRSRLVPCASNFDFRKNLMVVWPLPDFSVEAAYDLGEDDPLVAEFVAPANAHVPLPQLRKEHVLLRLNPLPRTTWMTLWEQGGPATTAARIAQVHVLPHESHQQARLESPRVHASVA